MRVLLLGADGFIGRHIACHLRAEGHQVLAQARRTRALAAMGFQTLKADLTDPATHDPAFWRPHLDQSHLINAAGILTGTEATFRAVHHDAPKAALAALPQTNRALLISPIGLTADTPFAHWRRRTEALFEGHTILRPGLVLADTSYGGSSVLRALAALPFRTPVIGDGQQRFNPVHAADLAAIALTALTEAPRTVEVGGTETLTLADLTRQTRRWLGLEPQPLLPQPLPLARTLGHLGDALKLGPISATAIAQLQTGVTATPHPMARPYSAFAQSRPAGTQDLWHARLYLVKPLIRLTLAALWLVSAALGLLLPAEAFPEAPYPYLARLGGLIDLALGLALVRNWRPRLTALLQLAMVATYTVGLTLIAPDLWTDPYGGLLKNLPVLALLLTHLALLEER